MRYALSQWSPAAGWTFCGGSGEVGSADLVLYFGAREALATGIPIADLGARYPGARLVGCSSGGEILGEDVSEDRVVAAAIAFDKTRLACTKAAISTADQSLAIGRGIGQALAGPELRGLFVLSDGLCVNGTDLVRGLVETVGERLPITGGLAGDGDRFHTTLVGLDGPPVPGQVVAIGFYGASIVIGHGSVGGWDPFGPERLVTRAHGNRLYELDHQPALDLYKRYLGQEAANLPSSGLLFPLRIRPAGGVGSDVVRTIVNIDEQEDCLIFAGAVPQGCIAQLMKGNFDRLVDGAGEAARLAGADIPKSGALALLISCIGRRLLLGQRIGDEVEAVQHLLGREVGQLGFYSYGEISPHVGTGACELHNQTMTITLLNEA